ADRAACDRVGRLAPGLFRARLVQRDCHDAAGVADAAPAAAGGGRACAGGLRQHKPPLWIAAGYRPAAVVHCRRGLLHGDGEAGARVGAVIMCTMVGMALGGWMSGKIFDLTGSYQAAFINGIAWNGLNLAIAFWLLRKTGQRAMAPAAG